MPKFNFTKRHSRHLVCNPTSSETLEEDPTVQDNQAIEKPSAEVFSGPVKSISWDQRDSTTVPNEVTIYSVDDDASRDRGQRDNYMSHALQVERDEYREQLQLTKSRMEQLAMDLKKSRMQVAELINHNGRLLDELKAAAGKDDVTLEEHRLLRQELYMLKACLFLGAVFICCGGRADVIGIAAFVWIVADVSS